MTAARLTATLLLVGFVLFCGPFAVASEESRTVIGPRNLNLYDGANALIAGDAEEGVRLTLLGLNMASNDRERHIAFANLCAGYILLDQLDTALDYCNRVLAKDDRHWRGYNNRALIYIKQKRYLEAEQDILKGQQLNPKSRNLKIVRAMLLDETDPVLPNIVIDDRRQPPRNDEDH
jgi:tetratricopeptide (TPR) repeat protein